MAETAARPSFDEFYSSAAARLVRHSYALTGDLADAQDIAQEAFARAWQRWSAVRDCDSPEAWVRRVATNLAASRWRRIRVARAAAGQPAHQQAPEVSTDTVALVCGLRTLPERQRTVLVLHYMCDLSVDEIAAELGCPSGSVKSWLSRGRTALADAVRVVDPAGVQAAGPPEPAEPAEPAAAGDLAAAADSSSVGDAAPVEGAAKVEEGTAAADDSAGKRAASADRVAAAERVGPDLLAAPVLLASADSLGQERLRPLRSWPARQEPEASHA